MDIRKEIRNILSEVFNEAAPSIHFDDRVHDRLTKSIYTRPDFDYSTVEKQIELIKNTNFNPKESFAIFLNRYPVTYVSIDPDTEKASVGDEVWAVVRDNIITTIFFRNSFQKDVKVSNVNHILTIKHLWNNYQNSEKNEDGTVDYMMNKAGSSEGKRKKADLDLPIVELDGKNWYIDIPNDTLIYTKNTKKTKSINDLDEKSLEKVINSI